MSEFINRIGKLSPKQLMLLALEQNEKIGALESRARAPIAIVGMGCRFPGGANDPEAFWRLLDEGRDATGPIPSNRWDADAYFDPDPDVAGAIAAKTGGFLADVSGFDAAFFSIAQREAAAMDPQHRLLLEVAWEALEHAGIPADSLFGTPAGVFVGLCNSDHFLRLLERGDDAIDAYLASGNAPSVAAGRIAYCLGLQGPAMTVDTACSSSLVALHLACRSLRAGESRVALACGVNVICSPQTMMSLSRSRMLAPDGRCKTFDAAADGFARGEGCGVLVLKRLDDALADQDTVLAVIRGTATNQDGRSGGLTVPNGPAQEAVIRAALDDANLSPGEIDYVEAHGTGTSLGDPIEVRALACALGVDREPSRPLLIGSVKTNIGHLESAAGVAGVIKVVLSLQHGRIPRHLNFDNPSPHIPWDSIPVRVTASGTDWKSGPRARRAGVSSFGFSGSNAHVVIEEAPAVAASQIPVRSGHQCLPLSARSPAALSVLAQRASDFLALHPGLDIASIAQQAGAGRAHHTHRLAVTADDPDKAKIALRAAAAGEPHPALKRGVVSPGQKPEVVFLFTGQGAQYSGMGHELYELHPVFKATIDECDAILGADAGGLSLKQVIWGGEAALHETRWTQPALFALEVATARMWQSFGIEPAAVIGHSLGEYAAACVAGVFSLADGLNLVAERGRLAQSLPPGGAMAALFCSEAEVADAIATLRHKVDIAAVNAADSIVVSGEAAAVDAIVSQFAERGIEARRLQVSFAAHSPLVRPILGALQTCAEATPMRAPSIPVAWNRGGLSLARPDASYWSNHLREPVRFGDGISLLHAQGFHTFLEVGPHPTLIALAQRTIGEDKGVWLHSMRRDKPDSAEIADSLSKLYVSGASIRWRAVSPRRQAITWPTYPFEHRDYWFTPRSGPVHSARRSAIGGTDLLGSQISAAVPIFEARLSPEAPAGLGDHRVHGQVIAPGPAILAMATAGAAKAFGDRTRRVEEFVFRSPVVIPDGGRIVQTHFEPMPDGTLRFVISSRDDDAALAWTVHASGKAVEIDTALERVAIAAIEQRIGPRQEPTAFLARLAELGIQFGPAFRVLGAARYRDGEALVEIHRPAARDVIADVAMIDGALQAVGLAAFEAGRVAGLNMLSEIRSAWWRPRLPERIFAHVRLAEAAGGTDRIVGTVEVLDLTGEILGRLEGVALDPSVPEQAANLCYEVTWRAVEEDEPAARFLAQAPAEGELDRTFSALASRQGLQAYDVLLPSLDRLCAAAIGGALRELGFEARIGRRFKSDDEAYSLGIAPRHRRLFQRILAILAEEGVLAPSSDGWAVDAPLPGPLTAADADAALARYVGSDGELRLLLRCASALPDVLRGEQDPLQLLFPDGDLKEAKAIYEDSAFARTYNETLAAIIRDVIGDVPDGAAIRVLEIGAGTGGTTRFVLPAMPGERTRYTFTDISPAFLDRAQAAWTGRPGFETAILDIERDPREQGFPGGSFDLVIASNVLHATTNLSHAIGRAHRLLAPGGLLLLMEGVAPERWVDLTFGLTKGWWHFTDDELRTDYPLVSRDSWRALLTQAGFERVSMTSAAGPGARARAQQVLIVAQKPVGGRQITVVSEPSSAAEELARLLASRGEIVRTWSRLPPEGVAGDVVLMPSETLASSGFDGGPLTRKAAEDACSAAVDNLVALSRHPGGGRAWIVTRGAQPAQNLLGPGARWQAPLLGLGRVFALEHPQRWGGLIDLPPSSSDGETAEFIRRALDSCDGEDQIAFRQGRRFAARLTPVRAPRTPPITLRRDGAYLVTGGFGGLGSAIAQWLAQRGAGTIVLAGRNPRPLPDLATAVEAHGARLVSARLDVGDEEEVDRFLSALAARGETLRGVVHAAADLGVSAMASLDGPTLERMLRPKIAGTETLERLTRGPDRDFMVLFSSSTALLGAAGFAHYAAANAFLDATALSAPASAGRIAAVDWGTWEIMRDVSDETKRSYAKSGLEPMPTELALDLMGRALASGERQIMVAKIDWSRMKPLQEARQARPFLSEISTGSPTPEVAHATPTDPAANLKLRLAGAADGLGEEILIDFVREMVMATLGESERTPPIDTGMFDLGMDSLMSLELKRRLETGSGLTLPSTLTFNHPTIRAMATYIGRQLEPPPAPAELPIARTQAPLPSTGAEDLDSLSDDDLAARLLARLEEIQ